MRNHDKAFFVFCGLAFTQSAHAYIDPGTGTFIVQMMLAALAGSLFYIKGIYYKVRRLFGMAKPESKPGESQPKSDSDSAQP